MFKDKIHIFQFSTNPVCAPYRLEIPGEQLNRNENVKVTRFSHLDNNLYSAIVNHADMIILQRLPMTPILSKICNALNALGKLIVYEIDDDLLDLNPESRYAQLVPEDYPVNIKKSIMACQAIQCSTKKLADQIKKIHPEVAILENQFDQISPPSQKEKEAGPIIVGYAAGEDHLLDWMTIKDKYNEVIVQLENAGHSIETWIIGDKEIYSSVAGNKKRYFPFQPRDKYLELLKYFDISIIPLADNPFNHCKSDIKFIESAASNTAVLASEIVYGNSVKYGETGLLFKTSEEFGKYLARMIQSPEMIRNLSDNALDYVNKNRLIGKHIKKWERTYLDWYRHKSELFHNTPLKQRNFMYEYATTAGSSKKQAGSQKIAVNY